MASKSKRRRKVLGASCILAALIIAGSSFAWFTSSDEVTNRLTATADYGVAIAEDFTPPENWLPGQKVDKNVGVVNTGNIDAFVRTWLEGEMKVLKEDRGNAKWNGTDKKFADSTTNVLLSSSTVAATDGAISGLTLETDEKFKNLNLAYYYGTNSNKKSLRVLDKTNKYANPNNPTAVVDSPDGYSEVMSVQAGGELVYTSNADVSFVVTPNQTMSFKSSAGDTYDVKGGTKYTVTVDNDVKAENGSTATDIKVDNTSGSETITVKNLTALYKYLGNYIDTNKFLPKTTGLYIFKRNTDMTNSTASAAITEDCEFSGYYYVAKETPDNGGDGVYFALEYVNDDSQRSEYVLDKAAASSVYTYTDNDNDGIYEFTPGANLALYTAKQQVLDNGDLTWTYAAGTGTPANGDEVEENGIVYTYSTATNKWSDGTSDVGSGSELEGRLNAAATSKAKLTASWNGGTATGTNDDISVDINLTNIGATAEKWTRIAANASEVGTFYYNNDVEEGASTARLVDSVELSQNTKKQAYLAFDFDLNVLMESQQITIADNGVESGENINPWAMTTGSTNDAAAGTIENTGSEISKITWTANP